MGRIGEAAFAVSVATGSLVGGAGVSAHYAEADAQVYEFEGYGFGQHESEIILDSESARILGDVAVEGGALVELDCSNEHSVPDGKGNMVWNPCPDNDPAPQQPPQPPQNNHPQQPAPSGTAPSRPSSPQTPAAAAAPQLTTGQRFERNYPEDCESTKYDWADGVLAPVFIPEKPFVERPADVGELIAHPERWSPEDVEWLLEQAEGWYTDEEGGPVNNNLSSFFSYCGLGDGLNGGRWVNGLNRPAEAYEALAFSEGGRIPFFLTEVAITNHEDGTHTFNDEPILASQWAILNAYAQVSSSRVLTLTDTTTRDFASSGQTLGQFVESHMSA